MASSFGIDSVTNGMATSGNNAPVVGTGTGIGTGSGSGSGLGNPPPGQRPVLPMAIGALFVLILIGATVLIQRGRPAASVPDRNSAPDPYAASISFSDLHMSAAENFAGGTVTYLEGKVSNNGKKDVTSLTLTITFKSAIGELVQQENMSLVTITTREPYIDTADLSIVPLRAGATRDFRLTLEHISDEWNRQYPALAIAQIKVK